MRAARGRVLTASVAWPQRSGQDARRPSRGASRRFSAMAPLARRASRTASLLSRPPATRRGRCRGSARKRCSGCLRRPPSWRPRRSSSPRSGAACSSAATAPPSKPAPWAGASTTLARAVRCRRRRGVVAHSPVPRASRHRALPLPPRALGPPLAAPASPLPGWPALRGRRRRRRRGGRAVRPRLPHPTPAGSQMSFPPLSAQLPHLGVGILIGGPRTEMQAAAAARVASAGIGAATSWRSSRRCRA
mmetsp:Transcript_77846/g.223080  ORF Transcript_77846/g.223080 Transcript_77846/m.223080 type:complete len:247 (-) Transcript_77846:75-815(-)